MFVSYWDTSLSSEFWRAWFLHVLTLLCSLGLCSEHLSLGSIWVTDHHLRLGNIDSLWKILLQCVCLVLNTCTFFFHCFKKYESLHTNNSTQQPSFIFLALSLWPKPHSFVYAEIIKIFSHYCVDLGKNINYISYVSITLKLGKHCPVDRLVFTVWPGDLGQVKIILGCFSA